MGVLVREGTSLSHLADSQKAQICTFPVAVKENGLWADLPSFEAFQPDACVHLSWSHTGRSDRDDLAHYTSNYCNTLALVQKLSLSGCHYFLGLGSHDEYGRVNASLNKETTPHPVTGYGIGKYLTGLASQKLCRTLKMKHAWLRLIAAYGPGEDNQHFIPELINGLTKNISFEMTLGDQEWDYLYIEDLTELIGLCLIKSVDGFFPVGSGSTIRLKEIVSILVKLKPNAAQPILGARPYSPQEIFYVRADMSELSSRLGWKANVTIQTGLSKCLENPAPADGPTGQPPPNTT